MVRRLRQRVALAVLVAVLLIPLLMANLGGIGQLLVCEAVVAQPFAVTTDGDGGAQVTSSRVLERDADATSFDAAGDVAELCGGVTADISAELVDDAVVRLTVTITNGSQLPWQGSIGLTAAAGDVDADLTTSLGEVPPGESRSDTLRLRVQEEQTEIEGRLLLGP